MKKLDISPISNSAQFFPKKGTLQFLQLSYQEGFTAIVKALIGPSYNPSTVYILYGVENSGVYPSYVITDGVVFYNGEIYYVDATSFTATGSNVAVFSTITSQYTTFADPVTFSDTTTHNIHNIVKMQLTQAASGSGISDYATAFRMNFVIPPQLNLTNPTTAPYTDNIAQLIGVYPNIGIYVPNTNGNHPILFAGNKNLGDIGPYDTGGSAFTVSFGTTLSTASYAVMGSFVSNGTPAIDAKLTWAVHNKTTSGFSLQVMEWSLPAWGDVQNVSFDYVIVKL